MSSNVNVSGRVSARTGGSSVNRAGDGWGAGGV